MSLISNILNHKDTVHNHNKQGTATYRGFYLTVADTGASQALIGMDLNETVQIFIVEAQNHRSVNVKHKNGNEFGFSYDSKRNRWLDINNRPLTTEAIHSQLELMGCGVFSQFIK